MGAVKPEFRASSPSDRERIAAFLREVFGSEPDAPYLNPANMEWKYWQPRSGWNGSRSFLLERENEIVAHGAAWPLTIQTPDGCISAFHLIDWAASPKSVGAGVSIMKRMAQLADVICVFGGSDMAVDMRRAMGFRPRNDLHVMALPIRPLRQIVSHQTKNWKSPARFLRNATRNLSSSAPAPGWKATSTPPQEIPADVLPRPNGPLFTFEQSAAEMSYTAECPTARSRFYCVTDKETPVGFFHLMFVPGQARIADASAKDNRPDIWNQLYRLAVAKAREEPNANELVAFAPTAAMTRALESAGFRTHHQEPALIFDPKGRIPEGAQLQLQMIHGDAAFWHRKDPEYLT